MAWFRVDDSFYDHPKVLSVSMSARGLWVVAGAYCAKHNTGGVIRASILKRLGGSRRQAADLVSAGLWDRADDGYRFVHWRKHQDGDYRPNIRASVRAEVMERDGHQCVKCGATDDLSLDHVQRYRDDGPDTVENLRVLCMPCNRRRG